MTNTNSNASISRRAILVWLACVAIVTIASPPASAATIELLSGAKVECKVLKKTDTELQVEAVIGGKTVNRSYPLRSIHVVTINDKRYVINEKTANPEKPVKSNARESAKPNSASKLVSCKVVQHREKQFYSSLTDTTAKIIAKQGVRGVDTTSSATITSQAIISATAKALGSGAK